MGSCFKNEIRIDKASLAPYDIMFTMVYRLNMICMFVNVMIQQNSNTNKNIEIVGVGPGCFGVVGKLFLTKFGGFSTNFEKHEIAKSKN